MVDDGYDEHSNRPAVMLIIRYLVFISDLVLFNQLCIDIGTVDSNMSRQHE